MFVFSWIAFPKPFILGFIDLFLYIFFNFFNSVMKLVIVPLNSVSRVHLGNSHWQTFYRTDTWWTEDTGLSFNIVGILAMIYWHGELLKLANVNHFRPFSFETDILFISVIQINITEGVKWHKLSGCLKFNRAGFWLWWHTSSNQPLRRMRQENHMFMACLDNLGISCLQRKYKAECRYSLVVEHVPRVCMPLGSILLPQKQKEKIKRCFLLCF